MYIWNIISLHNYLDNESPSIAIVEQLCIDQHSRIWSGNIIFGTQYLMIHTIKISICNNNILHRENQTKRILNTFTNGDNCGKNKFQGCVLSAKGYCSSSAACHTTHWQATSAEVWNQWGSDTDPVYYYSKAIWLAVHTQSAVLLSLAA